MRTFLRFVLIGFFCVGVGVAAVTWLLSQEFKPVSRAARSRARLASANPGEKSLPHAVPASTPEVPATSLLEPPFEKGGFDIARRFTGPIPDSLEGLRDAVQGRVPRGLAALQADLRSLSTGPKQTLQERARKAGMCFYEIGLLHMYGGQFVEADTAFSQAREIGESWHGPPQVLAHMTALRGICALRRGEISNCVECVGPSSCILPIAPEAFHTKQEGSRAAISLFTDYLAERPDDLRVRWLLNIAYMTLGEYPQGVPREYFIPIESYRSQADAPRFQNVSAAAGLGAAGPNQSGGCLFDDFDGDGWPDLLTTSLGADTGAKLFINRRDGTFADRTEASGLEPQVYVLNVTRTDFDNDGSLDVLMLRGGWEDPLRLSLLRNRGDGTFEDVTDKSGMGTPISTMAAAWGDYDNDGYLDLFVCGESLSPFGDAGEPDPRNRSRLYRNRGDGTFVDVASEAGVTNDRAAKGVAWGDYDDDGRLDLLVSNMGQPMRLYRNEGSGKFRDVAPELDLIGPDLGFACWFWDYDNDGRLDIFVNENKLLLGEEIALALGQPQERTSSPKLYRNLGADGFRDVTHDVGLDRGVTPMGCSFGDIDNDGYLDLYLGTGGMSYGHLVPNRLFRNLVGRQFADVTTVSGTGHLQKGHGISFADYNGDGALDLFVQVGGPAAGDKGYNLLFENPSRQHHWLQLKLVGTATNRAAIGARIHVSVKDAAGQIRSIYRTIGNNSSFGGNSLVESIGLLDSARVEQLSISWPTSATTQTFHDIAADRALVITEGSDSLRPLRAPATRQGVGLLPDQ